MNLCIKYKNQVFVAFCVYLGQMTCGYYLSWTAPVIPKLMDPAQSPIPRPLTSLEISTLASVLYIAGFPTVLIVSWFSNYKGRKISLLLAGCILTLSSLLLAVSKTYALTLTARFFVSVGMSMTNTVNIVYVGEIASKNIRGILLTGLGVCQTLGIVLIVSIGPYVPYNAVAFVGFALSALFFIAVLFIPESPVFYTIKGQDRLTNKILRKLHREDEIMEMTKNTNIRQSDLEEWKELFMIKCNRKALYITGGINMLANSNGMRVIMFYLTTIFEIAGSSIQPSVATIIVGCTQLFGSIITPFLIEISGRRVLLMVSTAICCLSLIVFGTYFYLVYIDADIINHIRWIPVTVLVIFFLSNNMGMSVIPSTLLGEMFRPNVRSKGTAFIILLCLICGFIVTMVFNYLATEIGFHFTFWILAFICSLAFVFTYSFLPETKGKSLTEIEDMLN